MEAVAVVRPPAASGTSMVVGLSLTTCFYYFSFPPFPTFFLAWIALVPLLWLLERTAFQFAFRTGYLAGLLSTGSMMFWLNSNSGATPFQATGMYLGAVMYLAVWWGLFAVLQKFFYRQWKDRSFWIVPFLWTALDYLQSLGELGFTWHSLSTGQTTVPAAIQFVEYTGMYGVTFWVAVLNVGFYFLFKWFRQASRRKMVFQLAGGLLCWAVFPFLHGSWVLSSAMEREGRHMHVGIVQPNIEPNVKWLDRDFAYNELTRLTRQFRNDSIDMIVWPETAVPNRLRLDRRKLDPLRLEIQQQHTTLLTGFPDRRFTATDSGIIHHSYNSVMLIRPDVDSLQIYDKMHLVPFGEHIPSFLGFLAAMAMEVGDFGYSSGNRYTVFTVPPRNGTDSFLVASVICLESIFPDRVRPFILRGAEVLVIVTNDAWYDGTFGPEQHARCAIYRAIEHRIPIARSANSGVSCIIDPYGRIILRAENEHQSVLRGSLWIPAERTFFTRYGNIFSYLMIGTSLILLLAAIRNRWHTS